MDGQNLFSPSSPAELFQTIIYLEDNSLVREGIANVLRFAGYKVAPFSSAADILAEFNAHPNRLAGPVLALLDMRLSERQSGLDVFRQLKKQAPNLAGIFLSGESKVSEAIEAMKMGAFDFLLKPVSRGDLLKSVERCFKHLALSTDTQRGERQADVRMFSALTQRESDVLMLVLKGQRGKEIARNLAISERTVKMHRGNIMKKLGARSLAQLAALHQQYLLRNDLKNSANLN